MADRVLDGICRVTASAALFAVACVIRSAVADHLGNWGAPWLGVALLVAALAGSVIICVKGLDTPKRGA